jgi:preprotein translocase subunit SecG
MIYIYIYIYIYIVCVCVCVCVCMHTHTGAGVTFRSWTKGSLQNQGRVNDAAPRGLRSAGAV